MSAKEGSLGKKGVGKAVSCGELRQQGGENEAYCKREVRKKPWRRGSPWRKTISWVSKSKPQTIREGKKRE